MTVEMSAPTAIRKPIHPRTVFRLPTVLCSGGLAAGATS